MKANERLLFLQVGRCFFCDGEIPKSEISVEHLQAVSRGGNNNDENCVVCCAYLNRLLGDLPLKDKFKVMLAQPKPFKCPMQKASLKTAKNVSLKAEEKCKPEILEQALAEFANSLKINARSRPRKLKTLNNHADNYLKKFSKTMNISGENLVNKAIEKGWIEVDQSNGIVYHLKNKTIKQTLIKQGADPDAQAVLD
jgi:hypothetical protein